MASSRIWMDGYAIAYDIVSGIIGRNPIESVKTLYDWGSTKTITEIRIPKISFLLKLSSLVNLIKIQKLMNVMTG